MTMRSAHRFSLTAPSEGSTTRLLREGPSYTTRSWIATELETATAPHRQARSSEWLSSRLLASSQGPARSAGARLPRALGAEARIARRRRADERRRRRRPEPDPRRRARSESNVVDGSTGRSPGSAPFRILSTQAPTASPGDGHSKGHTSPPAAGRPPDLARRRFVRRNRT